MFRTKVVEKIKTHISYSTTFFLRSCRLWDTVQKYGRAGLVTDDSNIGAWTNHAGKLKIQTNTQNI